MTPTDLRPAPLTVEFAAGAATAFSWTLRADFTAARRAVAAMTAPERADVALACEQLRAFALAEEEL